MQISLKETLKSAKDKIPPQVPSPQKSPGCDAILHHKNKLKKIKIYKTTPDIHEFIRK